MDSRTGASERQCPRCRRECRTEETFCVYCDQDLSQPVSHRLAGTQFSLAFLLAVTATVAVTLGIYRWSRDIAIAVWMVVLPALGRTALAAWLRRRRGGWYSLRGLGVTFLVSLAAMIPVLTLAFVGAILGWTAGMLIWPLWIDLSRDDPYGAALLLGGIGALAGAGYGLWVTRPEE